jgi:hypothetical protein
MLAPFELSFCHHRDTEAKRTYLPKVAWQMKARMARRTAQTPFSHHRWASIVRTHALSMRIPISSLTRKRVGLCAHHGDRVAPVRLTGLEQRLHLKCIDGTWRQTRDRCRRPYGSNHETRPCGRRSVCRVDAVAKDVPSVFPSGPQRFCRRRPLPDKCHYEASTIR